MSETNEKQPRKRRKYRRRAVSPKRDVLQVHRIDAKNEVSLRVSGEPKALAHFLFELGGRNA